MGNEAVRRLRAIRGLSLGELAKVAGISKGTLSRLERGQIQNPRMSTVARLAQALDVPGWLLYTEIVKRAGGEEGISEPTSKGVPHRRLENATEVVAR